MFLPSPEKIVPTQEGHRITFTPLNTKMFKAKKKCPHTLKLIRTCAPLHLRTWQRYAV